MSESVEKAFSLLPEALRPIVEEACPLDLDNNMDPFEEVKFVGFIAGFVAGARWAGGVVVGSDDS